MDLADDVDMFEDCLGDLSDIDVLECNVPSQHSEALSNSTEANPIRDHLLEQLNEVCDRVESTKRQIAETVALKTKVLHKFSTRAFYGGSSSSDSESDLFTAGGEPTVRRHEGRKHRRKQPLVVGGAWQHVVEDKWVVGVVLENRSHRDLYDLDLHISIKGAEEFSGLATFWTKDSKGFWRASSLVKAKTEVVSTVVLDLPDFGKSPSVELFGTVAYDSDGNLLQTLIPKVEVNVKRIQEGIYQPRTSEGTDSQETMRAVLTWKSLGMEKSIELRLTSPLGKDVGDILEDLGFDELSTKLFLGRIGRGTLERCILELTPVSALKYNAIIYARSVPQLNIFLRLLLDALPNCIVSCDNVTADEVIEALETELNLYLTNGNTADLRQAILRTDLICNAFENGRKLYESTDDKNQRYSN